MLAGGLALLTGLTGLKSEAQQTIFNVPSADVTPPGRLFLQHESQFRSWKPGRFLVNTEYAALGVGHNTELDLTLFNVSAPASENISLGVGFKTAIPVLAKKLPQQEIKWTFGTEVPVSLQGNGVGNWTYTHASFRLPKVKTRLTAGVSYGTKQIFNRRVVSAIAGIEHPLNKRVSILADWYSGTHGLGYLITGASVALPADTNLYLGYQIPNTQNSGRSGFVVELAKLLF
jgi:hypothetical protein